MGTATMQAGVALRQGEGFRRSDRMGMVNAWGRVHTESSDATAHMDGRTFAVSAVDPVGQPAILLMQHDIEQVAVAKGVILAGTDVLRDSFSVAPGGLDKVVIAGAFGSLLDSMSPLGTGLPPCVPGDSARLFGKGPGIGACLMLGLGNAIRLATGLAHRIDRLHHTLYPRLSDLFANGAVRRQEN